MTLSDNSVVSVVLTVDTSHVLPKNQFPASMSMPFKV